MKNVVRTTAFILGSAGSALSLHVSAQNNQADPTARQEVQTLEEVVVTSRRVEETLQTIPVAVTPISNDMLIQARIVDTQGLQKLAPSLSVAKGAPSASGFAYVGIRGATTLAPGISADPAVAIYLDGIYVPRPSQGLTDINDMQRIEVLRGPQGTLFGRNTTGGAISLITNNPTDKLEGEIRAEAGDYDHVAYGGIINIPLAGVAGDELGLRISANHREHSGYGKNPILDNRDANDLDSDFVRGKLRWTPAGSDWDVTLSGDYNKITDKGQLIALRGVDLTIPPLPAGGPMFNEEMEPYLLNSGNWYKTNGQAFAGDFRIPEDSMKAYGGGLDINGTIGNLGFRSLTGYRYSNSTGMVDLDATPTSILATESGYKSDQWSQEFQLTGELGDKLDWITGVYYSYEEGVEYSDFQTFAAVNELFGIPATIGRNDADVENTSAGVFVQSNYEINSELRLTTGLRWTWDKRKVVLHNINDITLPPDAMVFSPQVGGLVPNCNVAEPDNGVLKPCNQTQDEDFDYPAWVVSLDYAYSDDTFLYAKTSGASKAGGWNLRVGSLPAFKQENVVDVELGAKMDMLDGKMRTNVAVFYSWYDDLHRNANELVDTGTGPVSTQFLRNAGDAEIWGAEFEISALPWQGMIVNANLSLMDGEYKSGSFKDTYGDGQTVDRSNEDLPQLPEMQFNIGATQNFDTSLGELAFHVNYAYIDNQTFSGVTGSDTVAGAPSVEVAALQNKYAETDSYGLTNARISLLMMGGDLELAVYGTNLTDEKYLTRTFADLYSAVGIAMAFPGDPQTFGGSIQYKF